MQQQAIPFSLHGIVRSIVALVIAGSAMCAVAGTSSVVSTGSESIGSSSTSIEKSSNSISGGDRRVAQGDYTVTEVAALEQRPGIMRVHLQAVDGTDDFYLLLPRQAVQRGALAPGQVIAAQQRPYGIAFAAAGTNAEKSEPFFLVLDDAWYRELDSRPISS
ncbi:MAG: hypothetical protein H7Y28_06025 [Rhodoferax sp.]|nr:hypothetical protein [Rhodoferax sp.]